MPLTAPKTQLLDTIRLKDGGEEIFGIVDHTYHDQRFVYVKRSGGRDQLIPLASVDRVFPRAA